jgi:hypothetical protein
MRKQEIPPSDESHSTGQGKEILLVPALHCMVWFAAYKSAGATSMQRYQQYWNCSLCCTSTTSAVPIPPPRQQWDQLLVPKGAPRPFITPKGSVVSFVFRYLSNYLTGRLGAGFSPRRPGIQPRSGRVAFVVYKEAVVKVFSEYFGFP